MHQERAIRNFQHIDFSVVLQNLNDLFAVLNVGRVDCEIASDRVPADVHNVDRPDRATDVTNDRRDVSQRSGRIRVAKSDGETVRRANNFHEVILES